MIGRAHLRTLGWTPDPAGTVHEIIEDFAISPEAIGRSEPGELRALLQAKNQADFAANRTVQVNGWIFGSTETRLFCLAALT